MKCNENNKNCNPIRRTLRLIFLSLHIVAFDCFLWPRSRIEPRVLSFSPVAPLLNMVLIVDDISLIGAQVRINLCYSTCSRHMVTSRPVTNWMFLSKKHFFSIPTVCLPFCVQLYLNLDALRNVRDEAGYHTHNTKHQMLKKEEIRLLLFTIYRFKDILLRLFHA